MSLTTEERRIDRELHRLQSGSDPFAAAMRATRMPMLITDPRQADNPIVFVNDAFLRLTGYTREETLGRNCRFLQGPGTNVQDVARVRQAIVDRVALEIDLLNYRKDGTVFWNRLLLSPVFDGDTLTYFFASQYDVTPERVRDTNSPGVAALEMQQRVADLTASEERMNFTLKAGGLGTWTLDVPSSRLVASAICKANFGRGPAETLSYEDLQSSIFPDDLAHWRDRVQAALAGDGELHVEYRAVWPDQSIHWIEIRAETRFDENHHPLIMSGVSIDITERRAAEAHRDLLTKELGHRIKNMLATVQSIVSQSLRTDRPAMDVRSTVTDRLQALGGALDVLTGQDFDTASIREIVAHALRPFNASGRLHHFGPDLELTHTASTALAMALHEMATNAVKYGALSGDEGRVRVEWEVNGGDFRLSWEETGGPAVEQPTRKGFGSSLIERVLSIATKGAAQIDYLPAGLRFSLITRVAEITPSSSVQAASAS